MSTRHLIKVIYSGKRHIAELSSIIAKMGKKWQFIDSMPGPVDNVVRTEPFNVIILVDSKEEGEIIRASLKSMDSVYGLIIFLNAGFENPGEFNDMIEFVRTPIEKGQLAHSLFRLASTMTLKRQLNTLQNSLELRSQELSELNKIGIALSAERDPDILLEMILRKAREITSADAGSLYLIEKIPRVSSDDNNIWADKHLRFKLAQNDTLSASYKEFIMPIEKKSMAGYTVLSGNPINIADAYALDATSEFQHNRSFDKKMGYRTKSVLCIPMRSHQGEMIGVLQLINRKRDWNMKLVDGKVVEEQAIPFDDRCLDLAFSLASQAAVSIENMNLYEEIKRLFDGFILASVHAIEQRDPTTSGHSERVAILTVGMATQVDRMNTGPYKNVTISRDAIQQIKYASLLHDFGKIGVREHVLVKAKKLYPEQLEAIKFRFRFIKKAMELKYSQDKIRFLLEKNRTKSRQLMESVDEKFIQILEEMDDYLYFIIEANEPRVLAEQGYEKLLEIGERVFAEDGHAVSLLSEQEIQLLSIAKGSLSEDERREIESHVTHTYNFLSKIPWASNLNEVPQIAYAHHEKLDGSGYPRKLGSSHIPLPSKMMTISDIYDALTAWDRPYKKAVPRDKALAILEAEVKEGKIAPELFKIFMDAEIYKLVKRPEGS